MMPELLLLVGQGSERFFSSENKTKQKNPGSNVKSLLNLFGADDLSNWNGFWKQSWELGWGTGHLLLGETRKNRDRSLTRRRMEGSLPAGNMVPINKTLFSSILLKSHKTSEDFTANCQVTLQTVRSRITKKKKKTQIILQKLKFQHQTPPENQKADGMVCSAAPSLWSRAWRPLLLCCYWKTRWGCQATQHGI